MRGGEGRSWEVQDSGVYGGVDMSRWHCVALSQDRGARRKAGWSWMPAFCCSILLLLPFFHSTYPSSASVVHDVGVNVGIASEYLGARLFCWLRSGVTIIPHLCSARSVPVGYTIPLFAFLYLRRRHAVICSGYGAYPFYPLFRVIYPVLVPWRAHPGPVHGRRYLVPRSL